MLGVFIAVLSEMVCGVVWEAEKDDEMAEGTDTKGWLDKPVKVMIRTFQEINNILITKLLWCWLLRSPYLIVILPITKENAE